MQQLLLRVNPSSGWRNYPSSGQLCWNGLSILFYFYFLSTNKVKYFSWSLVSSYEEDKTSIFHLVYTGRKVKYKCNKQTAWPYYVWTSFSRSRCNLFIKYICSLWLNVSCLFTLLKETQAWRWQYNFAHIKQNFGESYSPSHGKWHNWTLFQTVTEKIKMGWFALLKILPLDF